MEVVPKIFQKKQKISKPAIAMGVYLFLFFFVALYGNYANPILNKVVLWVIGPLITLYIFIKDSSKATIPKEYFYYGSLIFFALFGYFQITDFTGYYRYLQVLVSNCVLMVILFKAVQSSSDWIFLLVAFLVSILTTVFVSYIVDLTLMGDYQYRLSGLTGNANGIANYSRVAIMLLLFFSMNIKSKMFRLILFSLVSLLLYLIILTASRGNFINSLFIILLFILINYFYGVRSILFALFIYVFGSIFLNIFEDVLSGFFLYDRLLAAEDLGDESRVQLIINTWHIFLENPILGTGLYQYMRDTGGMMSHTDILDLAVQLGIFGAIAYSIIYYRIIKRLIEFIYRIDTSKFFSKSPHWLLVILCAELLSGFTNNNWFNQLQMVLLSFLITYIYKFGFTKKVSLSLERAKGIA